MAGLAYRTHDSARERIDCRDRLARVLDTAILLPALRSAWHELTEAGTSIAACAIERVFNRPGGGFVVSIDARFEEMGRTYAQPLIGEVPPGDARAHFDELARSFKKTRRRRQLKKAKHLPAEFCFVPELHLVVRRAGLDEKILGLELLQAPSRTSALLPEVFQSESIRARLLAHRLHRRAVIELSAPQSEAVFLKFYKRGSSRAELNASLVRFLERTAFPQSGTVRVPQILSLLPSHAGFAMAAAPGRPVNELQGAARLNGMAFAGEALGRLHRLPLRLGVSFAADDEVKLLSRLTELAADIFPAYRRILKAGLDRVSARLGSCRSCEPGIVHRDFHERQIIAEGGSCHLIDFDTACNGDPNQDVGNFLAHLDLAELQGVTGTSESAAAFLEAYARAFREPVAKNVAAHRQSTLLRLACIYAFSTRWSQLSPRLIQTALGIAS